MTVSQGSSAGRLYIFGQVLHASGPDQDRASEAGPLCLARGSWEIEVITFMEDGTTYEEGRGEIYADGCSKDAQYKMCG